MAAAGCLSEHDALPPLWSARGLPPLSFVGACSEAAIGSMRIGRSPLRGAGGKPTHSKTDPAPACG